MPGQLKIFSISTVPASSPANVTPMTVMIGTSAARSTWRVTIVCVGRPLAYAART